MDIDFWLERWDNDEIGFHQQDVNPYLAYFYGEKGPAIEQREKLKVFVPMCGKSKDMLWLSQNNYKVLAVECSDRAVKNFFEENALNYKHAVKDEHALYQSSDLASVIEIYQGDFFSLQRSDIDDVTDIFDRASLIALPVAMREQYAKKMAELQKSGIRTLLVTLTYDQSEMDGPPFSVTEDDVSRLYAEKFSVEKLCFKEIINDEPGFKERGLTSLVETVYKLVRK
ncbi:MAG: thiopurine S-methyltransferase [Gammaproteobacteria bacterium]